MADTQQVVREFLDLSVEEKREAKEALGMKEASEGTNILWVMIVTAFVIVLLGGGYLLYDMSKNEQDTSVDPADNHDGFGRSCRTDGPESCAGEEVRAA
jgi:hypothetical protein